MVEQFGLAMILSSFVNKCAFTSGTISFLVSSIRQAEELSITVVSALANLGAHSKEVVPPAENKATSGFIANASSKPTTVYSFPSKGTFFPNLKLSNKKYIHEILKDDDTYILSNKYKIKNIKNFIFLSDGSDKNSYQIGKSSYDYLNLDNNENGIIENDLSDLIDESRSDGIDNDNDWIASIHDVGSDGVADTYDSDGTEGNGYPDSGEPNFDRTDPDESDQIGLTSFDYFVPSGAYPMSDDEALWEKLSPGFFDVPQSIQNGNPISGEDGDFIFGSGYFPLRPGQTERFSIALIYGENKDDLDRNKEVVQEIYDNDYYYHCNDHFLYL